VRKWTYILKAVVGACVVCAAVAVISGCGSSNTAPKASAANAKAPNAKPPTGKPIVLGNIGNYTGPTSQSIVVVPKLLQRWADGVNKAGGINGHPVKVISLNDATDPTTNLNDAKQLVQLDHVIGLVGDSDNVTDSASAAYLKSSNIPVVGGDSQTKTWFANPNFFADGTDESATVYGAAVAAKAAGVKKLAIMGCPISGCTDYTNLMAPDSKSMGINVVSTQTLGLTQTQFTPNCLSAQQAGATALYVIDAPSVAVSIEQACSSIGYKPMLVLNVGMWTNQDTTLPGVNATGSLGIVPWTVTKGTPALVAWGKAIAGFPKADVGTDESYVWAGAQLIQQALTAGVPKGGKPTTAELYKGLYSITSDTLGGLTVPLTFKRGKPSPKGTCWFVASIKNQKFTSTDKVQCKK
jgi:branched-chain amino acid transport system substrate-binding protein